MSQMLSIYSTLNNKLDKDKYFYSIQQDDPTTKFIVKNTDTIEEYTLYANTLERTKIVYSPSSTGTSEKNYNIFIANLSIKEEFNFNNNANIVCLNSTKIFHASNSENKKNKFTISPALTIPASILKIDDNKKTKFSKSDNYDNFSISILYNNFKYNNAANLNDCNLREYSTGTEIHTEKLDIGNKALNIYSKEKNTSLNYTEKLPILENENLKLTDNSVISYDDTDKYKLTIKKDINETNNENQCFFEGTNGKIYKEVEYNENRYKLWF